MKVSRKGVISCLEGRNLFHAAIRGSAFWLENNNGFEQSPGSLSSAAECAPRPGNRSQRNAFQLDFRLLKLLQRNDIETPRFVYLHHTSPTSTQESRANRTARLVLLGVDGLLAQLEVLVRTEQVGLLDGLGARGRGRRRLDRGSPARRERRAVQGRRSEDRVGARDGQGEVTDVFREHTSLATACERRVGGRRGREGRNGSVSRGVLALLAGLTGQSRPSRPRWPASRAPPLDRRLYHAREHDAGVPASDRVVGYGLLREETHSAGARRAAPKPQSWALGRFRAGPRPAGIEITSNRVEEEGCTHESYASSSLASWFASGTTGAFGAVGVEYDLVAPWDAACWGAKRRGRCQGTATIGQAGHAQGSGGLRRAWACTRGAP